MARGRLVQITVLVIGALLIAGAFITAFVVEPDVVAQLPDDTNAQRSYAGTFTTLLDARAVAQGNLAAALKANVPLAIDRRVKVLDTDGDTALVSDERTTTAAGTAVEHTVWQYALDRSSLEPVTKHPSSWQVVNASGLTIGWPFGSQQKTYTGWVPESATTTPVDYVKTEKKSGLQTYVYRAKVSPVKITDSQVLASLPKSVPASLLRTLASAGPVSAAVRAQLAQLLPRLGNPVPLTYTIELDDTFWVEPETGVVIDVDRTQKRLAGVSAPGGTFVPLLPVSTAHYTATPAGIDAAVHDANKGRDAIQLVGTTLPVIGGVVGALVVVAALLVPRLRRRRSR